MEIKYKEITELCVDKSLELKAGIMSDIFVERNGAFWYEGRKDSDGNYTINPGWVYPPSTSTIDEIIYDEFDRKMAKAIANWFIGPIMEFMNKNGHNFSKIANFFDSKKLYDLIVYVECTDLIDFSTAKSKLFPLLVNNFTEETAWEIIERLNILERADSSEVENMINEVLSKYPDKVSEYKAGKVGLLSLFMGEVMKLGKGKVKPQEATELLKRKLEV